MALLPNGLETLDLGSTAWRDVVNANLYRLLTKDEIKSPNYDHVYTTSNKGPVLTDRATGHKYRLYVNNGVLSIDSL